MKKRMIYILQNYLLEHSDFSKNFIEKFDELANIQRDKKINEESWYWREQHIPLDKWRRLSGYFLEVMYQFDEKLSLFCVVGLLVE